MSRLFEKQEIFRNTFPQSAASSFSRINSSNGGRTSNGPRRNFSRVELWKTSPAAGPWLSASPSAQGRMKPYAYIVEGLKVNRCRDFGRRLQTEPIAFGAPEGISLGPRGGATAVFAECALLNRFQPQLSVS